MKLCPLEVIVVEGYADPSEGDRHERKRLAEQRAQYVAEVLKRHGAPVSVLIAGGSTEDLSHRARGIAFWQCFVEIEAMEKLFSRPCQIDADAHGFYPDPTARLPTDQR